MKITIKTSNGMELAGMFAGMLAGGQTEVPPFSLSQDAQDEDAQMRKEEQMTRESERIKDIIAASGLSKSAFASAYGIPYYTIQKWTDGNRIPPEYVINLLERAATADNEIRALEKKRKKDILDVATGKKKVNIKGNPERFL